MKLKLITQLLVLLLVNGYNCFNLDVNNYIRHEGQDGSMFGFSVTLHQEQQRSWVIIGAPKADTSQYQPGVRQGGAVYRCDISDDNRCQIINFDSQGNNINERNEQIDTKSNQWFGATVSSAGINGPLVACAPRYVYHQHQPKKVERIEPVGTCFIAKDNFREYQEYSPCRTMYWGYHRQGSCQAGLSAAVNKAGDRLFVGAPGSWYWQGQVYSINTDAVFPYKPPRYGQFGDGGQTYSTSLNNPKDKVYSTKESSSKEDDSYLGYSSISGDFTGDGLEGVAVGMPRGGGLLGKVLIFSWNLTNQVNITGEQIGAYFGYSLCSVDVDGDKLDDLIIGAPMYTEPNNEGKYETGRVYIVYQNKFNKFKELETREGTTSKGRFGLSLASLGDINLDGYGDFAVGAPYDGPEGRGAVYVFHGSKNGVLPKASQVIYAEDVAGTQDLRTFGFSVSGGIDLDGNQYPDMVVGAYDSNRAIVFKSRAVAVMEASTVLEADNKLISLEEKNCSVGGDRKKVTCTVLKSCLKYNGINLPSPIDLEISWVLDSKKEKTPRMFFLNNEGRNIRNSSIRLERGKQDCRTEPVYIADGIRDKLTPLEVEMKYSIRQSSTAYTASSVSRRRRANLDPVLDENRGTVQRDSINIMKNCGRDNVCIPDLRLDVKTNEKYVLGSNESLTADVLISNFGEDAFEASFFMNIPQNLNYKSTKGIGLSSNTSFSCTAPSYANNNTLQCEIGNPMPAGKAVNFRVLMEPSKKGPKQTISPFFDFYMEANSTNEEVVGERFDNVLKKSVAISLESDLSISGSSTPEEFHYNISQYKSINNATHEGELGPHVVHIYDIRNNGTSTIDEIEVFIHWPAETLDGKPLMYLMSQPETLGPVQCDLVQYVNQRNLKLDVGLERKSYLDKNKSANRKGDAVYSSVRYNAQGGVSSDDHNSLDDSQESSDVYKQANSNSAQTQRWRSASSGGQTSGSGAVLNRNTFSNTHQSAGNSGGASGTQTFKWEKGSGQESGIVGRESSGVYRGGQQSGTQYEGRQQSSESQGTRFDSRHESGATHSSDSRSGYDRSQNDYERGSSGFEQSGVSGGNAGSNAREYEYRETWNSTSVNGGPMITHHSSQNRTKTRGQDGRVSVTETSTERVILGRVGWDDVGSTNSERRYEDSSQSTSQTQIEYEKQHQEYLESQRRYQEEERRRQQDERRRQQEEQRRVDEERYRLEEERRVREEERRRYQQESSFTSRTSAQGRGGSDYESSYNRHIESGRQSGGSSSGSRSVSGSNNIGASGRSEVNFETNVDQDISKLAARTHAEQGGSSGSSGRRRMQSQQDGESPRSGLVTGVTSLERAAQGGSGLQTVGLELDVLGARNNVDEEMRNSAASGGIAGGSRSSSSSYNTQHSSGGRQVSSSSSGHGYTHSSQTGAYQQYSNENSNGDDYEAEEYDENEEEHSDSQHSGGRGGTSWKNSAYTFSSKGPLNANPGSVDQKFKLYPKKRDVSGQAPPESPCTSTNCGVIRCVVGPIAKNNGALVALRTRMVAQTLHKLGGETEVKLSTMAEGRITKLPYIGEPSTDTRKTHEVFVTAIPDQIPKPDVVPLWIFVLAACAGALILLLLIYLLYKCGFFKRNRPTGAPHERQPLNRNGNNHGDEHL